jgi:FSR family fosmidomycin resistance protein-like MFS transporter
MTLTEQTAVVDPPSAWRRMRLWALAHAIDDLYQGLVPSIVPYFVLDRHYGYVAASGLTLAATLGSSLPQPVLGVIADRRNAGWMAGAGVGLAGLGLSVAGLLPGYGAVWCAILLSGIGISMFHPAAGKAARVDAGDSAAAMSLFAAGGSVGFFLAPALATPALIALGLPATALFLPPAALISFILLRKHRRETAAHAAAAQRAGRDRWGPFAALTGIEALRSVTFFGLNIRTVQLGTAVILPVLGGLLVIPGALAPLPFALATGIALNIPFAVLIKLGQDYLPTRPGTAAGVTLGLGVSVGGLAAPLLALIANSHGPRGALMALLVVPPLAIACGLLLRDPGDARRRRPRELGADVRPDATGRGQGA